MAVFRETEYVELWGQSPTATFGLQQSEAVRTLLVDWNGQQQALLDFMGYATAVPYTNTKADGTIGTIYYLSRVTPDYHPTYLRQSDKQPYLWADSVSFEPFGMPVDENGQPQYGADPLATVDSENVAVYRKAKMTVHYGTRLYPILDDDEIAGQAPFEGLLKRYVEIQRHPQAEYLTINAGIFKYADDKSAIQGTPGKIQSMSDLTLIWRQVPRRMIASAQIMAEVLGDKVQEAAFDYAVGRVNSEDIWGFPAGTLLCEPMEFTPWRQCDGEQVWDIAFHFKLFRKGHNFLLKVGGGATPVLSYVEVSTDGVAHAEPAKDGVHIYDSCDMNDLFMGYDYSAGFTPGGTN